MNLTITPEAASHIRELVGEKPVRVYWHGGYGMAAVEKPTPEDEVLAVDNITFVVDAYSREHVDGATVDWAEGLISSGFSIKNPSRSDVEAPPCGGCAGCGTGDGCGCSG
jgi:iron-sulfur cluster assembly protein